MKESRCYQPEECVSESSDFPNKIHRKKKRTLSWSPSNDKGDIKPVPVKNYSRSSDSFSWSTCRLVLGMILLLVFQFFTIQMFQSSRARQQVLIQRETIIVDEKPEVKVNLQSSEHDSAIMEEAATDVQQPENDTADMEETFLEDKNESVEPEGAVAEDAAAVAGADSDIWDNLQPLDQIFFHHIPEQLHEQGAQIQHAPKRQVAIQPKPKAKLPAMVPIIDQLKKPVEAERMSSMQKLADFFPIPKLRKEKAMAPNLRPIAKEDVLRAPVNPRQNLNPIPIPKEEVPNIARQIINPSAEAAKPAKNKNSMFDFRRAPAQPSKGEKQNMGLRNSHFGRSGKLSGNSLRGNKNLIHGTMSQNLLGSRILIMDASDAARNPSRLDAGYCIKTSRSDCALLPAFIIIGFAGFALSTLERVLQEHPQLVQSKAANELQFFARAKSIKDGMKNFQKYVNVLPKVSQSEVGSFLTFEYGSEYFSSPTCPALLNQVAPKMKVIIVLRDPVEQVYTSFQRECLQERLGFSASGEIVYCPDQDVKCLEKVKYCTPEDFDRLLLDQKGGFKDILLQRSAYQSFLQNWSEYFDRPSMLILDHQDFSSTAISRTMQRVSHFLPLENFDALSRLKPDSTLSSRVEDHTQNFPMSAEAREFLQKHFAQEK